MKKTLILSVLLILTMILASCGNDAPASVSETGRENGQQAATTPPEKNQPNPSGQPQGPSDNSAEGENGSEQGKNGTDVNSNDPAPAPKGEGEKATEPKEEPLVFSYPDAVRGIYVTAHSAGGSRFEKLLQLVDKTDLNAMVIDIKDDYGNITYKPEEGSPLAPYGKPFIKDPKAMLKTLSEHKIYPIARIVVFKDSVLAEKKPNLSFQQDGKLWRNRRGEAFVNPFLKEVWEHNVALAKEAAKMGFQEIQFDYVRFPEGFEKRDKILKYGMGDYAGDQDSVQARVRAVTEFVEYAAKELEPLGVKVSVDIFGYTVTLPEAPGIGQNFSKISSNVDVISSMIYPSHWGFNNLGIPKPDLDPYGLVQNYVAEEKKKLFRLEDPPISRPWIQDFTASWLGPGNYKSYGKAEVEAQIRALNEAGIKEFLVWNAGNEYTPNVDYTPPIDQAKAAAIQKQDEELRLLIKQEREGQNAAAGQSNADSGTGGASGTGGNTSTSGSTSGTGGTGGTTGTTGTTGSSSSGGN